MQISADLGNSVCAQSEQDGMVCPSKLESHCLLLVVWTKLTTTQAHLQLKTLFTGQQFLSPSTLLMTLKALTEIGFLEMLTYQRGKPASNLPDAYTGI